MNDINQTPDDEREVPGLDSMDCTGVLIGNTDMPVPEWVPTEVKAGTTPLPGHEHEMEHGESDGR